MSTLTSPTEFNNIMIDIETVGMVPGSIVLQIAAVRFCLQQQSELVLEPWLEFNTDRPWVGTFNLADQVARGLKIDPNTLSWWAHPERTGLFSKFVQEGLRNDNISVIEDFEAFISNTPNTLVWTRGIDFDLPILEHLLRTYGMKTPWNYRRKADVRTYIRAAYGEEMPKRVLYFGTAHDAVVDCYNQIHDVQMAWARINERAVPLESME